MKRGIVITTSEATKNYLYDCLASLAGVGYPIQIVSNGGYDPDISVDGRETIINDWNAFDFGGLLRGKEQFDEFVHLHDSVVVKDTSLFDKLFAIPGHVFLTNGHDGGEGFHCMGKFVSADMVEVPRIDNKEDGIKRERDWLRRPFTFFEPDLPVHTEVFEEKYGRRRMKLENDYLIKWKGTFRF